MIFMAISALGAIFCVHPMLNIWAMKKTLVVLCILYKGIILPSYVVIIASYYKDPYEPTSITESKRFFFVAQLSSTLEKTQPPRFSLLVYATLLDSPAEVMSSLNEVGVVPCLPSGVWILK